MNEPMAMTQTEVAAALRVTPRTLQTWRASGTGPPWRRVGRVILYSRAAVHLWLENRPPAPVAAAEGLEARALLGPPPAPLLEDGDSAELLPEQKHGGRALGRRRRRPPRQSALRNLL